MGAVIFVKYEIVLTKIFKIYLEKLGKMTIYNRYSMVYDKFVYETDNIRRLNLFLERNDFMRKVNIKFRDVEQVRQFVNTIDKFDASFDLGSGKKVVDAKSILGVMALDLSGPLCLRYHSDDKEIEEKIAPFVYMEA